LQKTNIGAIIVAFFTLAINYGTRSSFGLFLKPLEGEFETSRAVISSILSITMLTYSTLAFFTGYLIDRFGPKVVLLIGGLLAATSFMVSSVATSLPHVTLSFGIIFGAATCFLSQITAVSLLIKLPSGGNAIALGLVGSGPAIGSLFLSPSIASLILSTDWRSAMRVIGWSFLAYLLLPVFLSQKHKKTDSSLFPKEERVSLKSIVFRDRNLGLLFLSLLLMSAAIYGVLSQEAAHATDRGMSLTEAAWALGLISGIGIIASPGLGWVSDRVRSKKKLGALILVMAVIGIFFIFIARSGLVLALGSIIVGTAYSSYVPILPSITQTLFGRDFFGRVWGLISMGGSIGAAMGSWLGGYFHDRWGNYNLFWIVLALCFLAASVALLSVDTEQMERRNQELMRES
jgi:MFS family permease